MNRISNHCANGQEALKVVKAWLKHLKRDKEVLHKEKSSNAKFLILLSFI